MEGLEAGDAPPDAADNTGVVASPTAAAAAREPAAAADAPPAADGAPAAEDGVTAAPQAAADEAPDKFQQDGDKENKPQGDASADKVGCWGAWGGLHAPACNSRLRPRNS